MHQIAASFAPMRSRRANVPARGPGPRPRDRRLTRGFPPTNGLNQLTSIAGPSTCSGQACTVTHDARGNVTFDPTTGKGLVYESQNELKGGMGFGIGYDALLRAIDTSQDGAGWKQFVYDGIQIVAELQPGQGITGRYVWGDAPDELLVDYVGSGTTNRRWAHADERGSIVALSDGAGNATINRYDEYGKPAATNAGRFQYTGQMWLPELGVYHYKARIYSPTLGRFYQTDPIGYGDGPNLYAYVGNDPVNRVDPIGLCTKYTSTTFWDTNGNGRVDSGERVKSTSDSYSADCFTSRGISGIGPNVGRDGGDADGVITVIGRRLPHRRTPNPQWPAAMQPNGCSGVPALFPESCSSHDVCYVTLGYSKGLCDREFYFNMLAERPDRRGLALDYYIGVINLGGPFYRSGQEAARNFQRSRRN